MVTLGCWLPGHTEFTHEACTAAPAWAGGGIAAQPGLPIFYTACESRWESHLFGCLILHNPPAPGLSCTSTLDVQWYSESQWQSSGLVGCRNVQQGRENALESYHSHLG